LITKKCTVGEKAVAPLPNNKKKILGKTEIWRRREKAPVPGRTHSMK
jgi:hypothetical protein